MTDPNHNGTPGLADTPKPGEPEPAATEDPTTDTLIGRTLKIATKYQKLLLAYLVSVAATIGGMSYLGYNDDSLQNRWWIAFAWLLTLLPLLATFLTMTLPAWRKKRREAAFEERSIQGKESRPGYFRIGPYEDTEQDREHFQRADQAHVKALAWIASSNRPLLFLTGASGAGKSSLLSAHVIPHLREGEPASSRPPTRVITLRSFDDPLAMLREQLLTAGVIWQKPPKVDEDTPLRQLLQDACEYLAGKKERLLLVLDQFEELLILHENPGVAGVEQSEPPADGHPGDSNPGDSNPEDSNPEAGVPTEGHALGAHSVRPQPPGDDAEAGLAIIEAVKQFLHSVRDEPLPELCVLLSLRTDYEGMLSRLELPPLEQGRNWFKVSPFTERAARDFLSGGFDSGINDTLLDRVLEEAATVEEARGLIRPITLNMLGTVLTRMSGELPGKEQRGGLLAADVRQTLSEPQLRDHATDVLTPLLTDAGTKHPRRVEELAKATRLEPHTVEGCLLGLSDRGLVRRLNRAPQLADRVWEISHDFAARLLVLILHTQKRTLWQRLRPAALPASIVLWLLVFTVLLPSHIRSIQEHIRGIPFRAANELRTKLNAKVTPPDEEHGWRVDLSYNYDLKTLKDMTLLLTDIEPESIDLTFCDALTSLDGLGGLTGLQSLNLSECVALTSVDGLSELTGLQTLHLSNCHALASVDGLSELTGLQTLSLNNCYALANVEGLSGLTGLQSLDLSGCPLTNLEELSGLTKLQTLNVSNSSRLTSVDVLSGLTGLQTLDLSNSSALTSVDVLSELAGLQTLNLSECDALTSVDVLSGLTGLQTLDLRYCNALTSAKELSGLTALQVLNLTGCPLTNLEELSGLTELQTLDLSYCRMLKSMEGLSGLTGLKKLDLRACDGLTDLTPLYQMKSLQRVGLNGDTDTISGEQILALKQALPDVVIVTGTFDDL